MDLNAVLRLRAPYSWGAGEVPSKVDENRRRQCPSATSAVALGRRASNTKFKPLAGRMRWLLSALRLGGRSRSCEMGLDLRSAGEKSFSLTLIRSSRTTGTRHSWNSLSRSRGPCKTEGTVLPRPPLRLYEHVALVNQSSAVEPSSFGSGPWTLQVLPLTVSVRQTTSRSESRRHLRPPTSARGPNRWR